MPLYDYQCDACGVFEVMRKLAERDDPVRCSRCDALAGRIQTSASLLLGSGGQSSESPEGAGAYGMRHRFGCGCC
ncbi:FmdB family zinc ribbon protein [Paraburkholderia sp. BCC1884]|uniref:FmdB family zinc ribbon protein n=1 Tax=Paraburkholderia sp. BCC1884 TaxID=2562668 RepID=UPI001183F177|nr:FmdB family zinc ribbon protein [Paraburkholderia sp. BCC1884]